EPVPVKPWEGVWNASEPGSMCTQIRRVPPPKYGIWEKLVGDEDCLFLNIYTPELPKDGSNPYLDVLFNIHSGAFMYGWGHEFGPEILMDRDIIWVTINYRLSVLGFLDTQDDVVPGGTSVQFHFLSPWSRGLFKGGISQSGTATVPWTIMEEGQVKAKKLGALVGCNTENTKNLVDCLRDRPARQLVQQMWHLQQWMYNPYSPFGPTIEVEGSNPFLTKHPIDYLLKGEVQDSPWIVSVTTEDGLVPSGEWVTDDKFMRELDKRFNELMVHILDFNYTVPNNLKEEVVDRIREHYLHNQSLSMKTFQQLTQIITDRVYLLDGARAAKLQASVNKSPVHFYLFGYRGKHSMTDRLTGININLGASHLDDTAYTIEYAFKTNETEEDLQMCKLLLDIWTSFAATGSPVPTGSKFQWEPTTPNTKDLKYLYIGGPNELQMRSSDKLGDPNFWDSLPIQEKQLRVDTPLTGKHNEL
ncbi:hypothetical protein L9F63_013171, partial [Diploptera punctata]